MTRTPVVHSEPLGRLHRPAARGGPAPGGALRPVEVVLEMAADVRRGESAPGPGGPACADPARGEERRRRRYRSAATSRRNQ